MVVAAVQETKWFEDEVNRVDNSVVLTAGRPIPAWRWQVKKRGEGLYEGVAIVLAGSAIKEHGKQKEVLHGAQG